MPTAVREPMPGGLPGFPFASEEWSRVVDGVS
jgi:hypothetical protein